MAIRYQFGTKQRDQVWQLEKLHAWGNGRGEFPICVHCDQPVYPDQAWDESHIDIPRAFGGKSVGCGHRKCNQLDNNKVVTPAFAKCERVRKKHVGIMGPGLGRSPMQGGRRSLISKTMRNGVQPRLTLAQKHAAFIEKRRVVPVEVADFSEPLEVYP